MSKSSSSSSSPSSSSPNPLIRAVISLINKVDSNNKRKAPPAPSAQDEIDFEQEIPFTTFSSSSSSSHPTIQKPISFEEHFYNPLLSKIKFISKSNKKDKKKAEEDLAEDTKNKLAADFEKLNAGDKEFATFMATQLPKLPNFQGLVLKNKAARDRQGNRMDAFDTSDKTIALAPIDQGTGPNPIMALIHEGTHAIDNLYTKTYQKKALEFLAKHLPDTSIDKDKGDWYSEAQQILPSDDFKTYYPFKKAKGDIKDSMYNLELPEVGKKQKIKTYSAAHKKLSEIPNLDDDLFFTSLSEFPAFVAENLSNPWLVDWNEVKKAKPKSSKAEAVDPEYRSPHNFGRKFLKKITKDTYKGFRKLDPKFSTKYPAADLNFLNRLADLRNKNKYTTPADYINHLKANL